MKRSLYPLPLIIILMLINGCTDPSSEISVNDLKCENLYRPLGIATISPRLSWKILSNINGKSQKAYQIIAASEEKRLDQNKADLWNSGKVLSEESVLVPWDGIKLIPGLLCYWKVRIWDENDKVSEWSKPSLFGIGLLDKSDWQAHYIGFTDTSDYCISPQLRKTFIIDNKADHILLHVNSLGYHEVWLNGKKAGECALAPAVSRGSIGLWGNPPR